MIRLFKYKCTASSGCIYEWGPNEACINCGRSFDSTRTIWEQLEFQYWKYVPYEYRPGNLWYALKCLVWKRYTTTKPRTLGHTWCDRNALMIHTVFEIAQRFIEEEGPKTEEEWNFHKEHNPGFYDSWLETKQITDWFYKDYDEDYVYGLSDEEFDRQYPWTMPPVEEYDGTKDERRSLERYRAEGKHELELLEKAKRLIDISPYYWT